MPLTTLCQESLKKLRGGGRGRSKSGDGGRARPQCAASRLRSQHGRGGNTAPYFNRIFGGDICGFGSDELLELPGFQNLSHGAEGQNPAGQPFKRVIEQGDLGALRLGFFLNKSPGPFTPDAVHGVRFETDSSHRELTFVPLFFEVVLQGKFVMTRKEFVLQLQSDDSISAKVTHITAETAIGNEMPVVAVINQAKRLDVAFSEFATLTSLVIQHQDAPFRQSALNRS